MPKAVVLGGSGQVGGMVVRALALDTTFDYVVVADLDIHKAESIANELKSHGVSARQVDGGDAESVRSAIGGSDLVVNCIGPFYRTQRLILETVIEAGINYVDVADDVSVMDEILALDGAAKLAGVTAVIGLGFSPGVTNLMGVLGSQALDTTVAIDIYHTHGGEPQEGPGVVGHRFHCMTVDCPMYLDGELKYVKFFEPEGIALRERVQFLGLDGDTPVYPYPHPEQVTMPRYLDLRRVTNKGSVLPEAYYQLTMDVCRIGLTATEPVEVKGQAVVPQDFAIAYIIKRRDEILRESNFGVQRGASIVAVRGERDGGKQEYWFKAYMEGGKHSGLGVSTGVPAAAGAVLLQQGKIARAGVQPPEGCVEPKDFFPLWYELVKLTTGRDEPLDLVLEALNEKGQVHEVELDSLYQ